MKKYISLLVMSVIFVNIGKAQLYTCQSAGVRFFSSTPVEDISAVSGKLLVVMNSKTRELALNVANTTFEFSNKLMQEHFNEKYMESEKYPNSTFKGKVNEEVDLSQDGEYNVTATGKLNIHGVEKTRTIAGIITVKEGSITLKSEFKIFVKDHNITIPKLVVSSIAEEIGVFVDARLMQKK